MLSKIKDVYDNNQKVLLLGALGVSALALAAGYGYKRHQLSHLKVVRDRYFATENLALYQHEAFGRDSAIKNVEYDLFLLLQKGKPSFQGRLSASFMIAENVTNSELKEFLFLDFQGEKLLTAPGDFIINGEHVSPDNIRFEKHRIYLPNDMILPEGRNVVTFKFENTYVNNSAGFHRFVDPSGSDYFFTHLEPFFCHRWFPCFDQPSFRAPLRLTVMTDEPSWKVIANGPQTLEWEHTKQEFTSACQSKQLDCYLQQIQEDQGAEAKPKLHIFEETPAISSYIYGLFVGPFAVFEDESNYKVPMRIFTSQAKKDYIDAKELFRVVQSGIDFYEEYFQCPFPFRKYDQIFCPEFRIGAMENVGAVSFNEGFLQPPEDRTDMLKSRLAYVALHELAHMWFGDLVTMKWWSDLWLKESFADFMAVTCLLSTPALSNYQNMDLKFVEFGQSALRKDIRASTHPISVEVKHTTDAVNIFDAICYSKGATFIKQMNYYLGKEFFREGARNYFQKFKYQNTELIDFISSLSPEDQEAAENLTLWTTKWLKSAGVNTLEASISPSEDQKKYLLSIEQGYPSEGGQVYREQVLDIALFTDNGLQTELKDIKILAKQVAFEREITLGDGEEVPTAVLVNANNKGYCRVLLDKQSCGHFLNAISTIKDVVNRAMIWAILADQVMLGRLGPRQFLNCVFDNLEKEEVEVNLVTLIGHCQRLLDFYMSRQQREAINPRFLEVLKKCLIQDRSLSQKTLLASAILNSTDDIEVLQKWHSAAHILGENSDQLRALSKINRYKILAKLFQSDSIAQQRKNELLSEEMKVEFSDTDNKNKLTCEGALPDPINKQLLYAEYVKGKKFNKNEFNYSAEHFYNLDNLALCYQIADWFFADLEKVFREQHRDYAESFFNQLSPTFLARKEDLKKLEAILGRALQTENTHFINKLKDEIEDFKVALLIRQSNE